MFHDTISDVLTRIRNAGMVKHATLFFHRSARLNIAISFRIGRHLIVCEADPHAPLP
jgi:hypothetical protein